MDLAGNFPDIIHIISMNEIPSTATTSLKKIHALSLHYSPCNQSFKIGISSICTSRRFVLGYNLIKRNISLEMDAQEFQMVKGAANHARVLNIYSVKLYRKRADRLHCRILALYDVVVDIER